MLGCNETVTLLQRREDGDMDVYTAVVIQTASWFGKAGMAATVKGLTPQNTCKVRIMARDMPPGVTPCKGDYMVRGVMKAIQRPADLEGAEYFLVTAVGDNRRGRLAHWVVSGA